MTETFKVGQRVMYRENWLAGWGDSMDNELLYWITLPYMVVKYVSPDGTSVTLQSPVTGSWDGHAITAYVQPVVLPEDLFTI